MMEWWSTLVSKTFRIVKRGGEKKEKGKGGERVTKQDNCQCCLRWWLFLNAPITETFPSLVKAALAQDLEHSTPPAIPSAEISGAQRGLKLVSAGDLRISQSTLSQEWLSARSPAPTRQLGHHAPLEPWQWLPQWMSMAYIPRCLQTQK